MKKPNTFIIGAPKCGTTSIYKWLSEHPNVFMSPIKEPHFFSTQGSPRSISSKEKYESLFAEATDRHKVVGEASTNYLYFADESINRILDYSKQPKFLVSLRNPVNLAISLHNHHLQNLMEDTENFRSAWKKLKSRSKGKNLPKKIKQTKCLKKDIILYNKYCKLGKQLENLFSIVSKNRTLILLLEDLKDDPKKQYKRILNFLNIPYDQRNSFPKYNKSSHYKFRRFRYIERICYQLLEYLNLVNFTYPFLKPIANAINRNSGKKPVSKEMKKTLQDYFESDIEKLSKIIGRDLSHWIE